jgi:HK97 family phage prohead protease
MERRFSAGAITVERRAEGAPPTLTGYAAVFYDEGDAATEYLFDQWRGTDYVERIMPGAFDRAMKEGDDVRALFNHNPDNLLGRTAAGTLTLSVDRKGLRYEITPPAGELGRSVVAAIERGDLSGSSFAFLPESQAWREIEQEGRTLIVREIAGVRLFDVGPVTYPAYEGTTAGRRAAGDTAEAKRAYDEWRAGQAKPAAPLAVRLAGYRARAAEAEAGA